MTELLQQQLPGTLITHVPKETGEYVGSPSIAILPDGSYVASHDYFGPKSTEFTSAVTNIFRSEDRGQTWRRVTRVEPAFWSNLFVHRDALYLLGISHHHGSVVIRRSEDGGVTWTVPRDESSGLLTLEGQYHTAPMPMLEHAGRIWRAVEDAGNGTVWGERYSPMLMSAAVDSDLLQRSSWEFTPPLPHQKFWLNGNFGGWLEGNAVLTPTGEIANLLRVAHPLSQYAALVTLSKNGKSLEFDPEHDFISLPGGATKFTVRYDAPSGHYWTLANVVPQHFEGTGNDSLVRNTLALMRSVNLRSWESRCVLLSHPDPNKHGFQYVDWLVEGADLVAISRTSFDDEHGGARNSHDANFLTFHRFPDFRNLSSLPL